jgi:toxin-antitoxin system PIN domain toxin
MMPDRVGLLDVNFLIALFDPDHIHHEVAHDWFENNRAAGWATSPITESGFLRVLSNPAYGTSVTRPLDLLAFLRQACSSDDYAFWPAALSLRDESIFNPALMRGHRQVTDIYLLGLAVRMGGRLVTFDRTIPLGAVLGATRENVAVVAPVTDEGSTTSA